MFYRFVEKVSRVVALIARFTSAVIVPLIVFTSIDVMTRKFIQHIGQNTDKFKHVYHLVMSDLILKQTTFLPALVF